MVSLLSDMLAGWLKGWVQLRLLTGVPTCGLFNMATLGDQASRLVFRLSRVSVPENKVEAAWLSLGSHTVPLLLYSIGQAQTGPTKN